MRAVLTRVWAICVKEVKHLRRDPRTLAATLLIPVVQLLMFSYAISFDVKDVPTLVVDQDHTPASRAYLRSYAAADFFHVVGEGQNLAAVDEAFDTNAARIAVVVPSGFAASLARNEKAEVAVLLDGSEPNTARIGQAYAIALNQVYSQRLTFSWADAQGLDVTAAGQLEPRVRTWYNPERQSAIFLIPGLMVVIIMIVTIQQTAVSLVRERDQGTAEQMQVSPLRDLELMVGKLLPWTMLAFIDMVVIGLVGMFLFGLPLRGSLLVLSVGGVLFVISALGIGLIVSSLAPTLDSANIIALLLAFLPGFLLSGFAFPLESIPWPLEWLSRIFPGRYMITIARGVFLKGSGFAETWPELVSLAGFALVVLALAAVLYRRRRTR